MGSIVTIQISPATRTERGARETRDAIDVVAGKGIDGDIHFGGESAAQVTLIAEEDVAAFNGETQDGFKPTDIGRNIVTRGVDVNALVGKTFRAGDAVLEGIEPCAPCATLGARLAHYRLTAQEVVKGLVNRGGLRARVVESGRIEVGSNVEV